MELLQVPDLPLQKTAVAQDAVDVFEQDVCGDKLPEEEAQTWRLRYRSLLDRADIECPPPPPNGKRGRTKRSKSRNLLERLRNFEQDVLRCIKQNSNGVN